MGFTPTHPKGQVGIALRADRCLEAGSKTVLAAGVLVTQVEIPGKMLDPGV